MSEGDKIQVLDVQIRTEAQEAVCLMPGCGVVLRSGIDARAWSDKHCRETGHSVRVTEISVVECPPN